MDFTSLIEQKIGATVDVTIENAIFSHDISFLKRMSSRGQEG
jgi:hypothetical protein